MIFILTTVDLCKENSDGIAFIPVSPPTQMVINQQKGDTVSDIIGSSRVRLRTPNCRSFSFATSQIRIRLTIELDHAHACVWMQHTCEKCWLHANRATRLIVRHEFTCCLPMKKFWQRTSQVPFVFFTMLHTEVPKGYTTL